MSGKLCTGFQKRNPAIIKESKAFCEGQMARAANLAFEDNPHAGGNAKDSWAVGWFAIDQLSPGDLDEGFVCCAPVGTVTGTPSPIIVRWVDAIPPVSAPQGGTWDIDLNDYVAFGTTPITFAVDTGALPTGITLNANGTFSGTVTNSGGAGQVTFIATNAAGDSDQSPSLEWEIA